MISLDDHKRPDGEIDWAAYKAAQVAAGEVCSKCSTYIISIFGNSPAIPRLCGSCKALEEDREEVTSDSFIRCPACGHQMGIDDFDGELHEDGSHDVTCHRCDHEFEVQTNVSFSFESPARLEKKHEA